MSRFFFIVIFSLFVFVGKSQTPLTQAEGFSVKDSEGNVYDLFDILDSGQFVLLDFFDVSCGPCQFFAPDIQQSYVNFGQNNADVFFIGLSLIGDNELLDEWDSTFGIQYPTISGFEGGGNGVHQLYQILSFPTLVLIAPDHSVASQIYLPDLVPYTSTIDSMLIDQGLSPVITGFTKLYENSQTLRFNNPVTDNLNIEFYSPENSIIEIVIHNFQGQLVQDIYSKELSVGNSQISVNVAELPKGLYVVSVISDNIIIESRKLIKQ